MSTSIKSFIAFASNDSDLVVLKRIAELKGLPSEAIQSGTIRDAIHYLKDHPSPDLLLVEIPDRNEASALLDALADVCDPDTKVMTMGRVNEYSFYCWLTEIGIEHYVLSPLADEALEHAYEKILGGALGKTEKPLATLVAVMGARGGVGATTVAINLAALIAEKSNKKVALIDLDPQEGSVALALDMEPSRGLKDVLEKPDRIDSLFLERVMSKAGKNLAILSAEESLGEKILFHEHAAEPLLLELRKKYDVVVLDVPRHMNDFAQRCLTTADHAILVTELSLLCLRDTLRMQDAMREIWKIKPPIVVANRMGLAAKQEIPVADFERGAQVKINGQISFVPDLFIPLSREVAIIKHKQHASMKALHHLAALMFPQFMTQETKEKKSLGFSLFKKKEG